MYQVDSAMHLESRSCSGQQIYHLLAETNKKLVDASQNGNLVFIILFLQCKYKQWKCSGNAIKPVQMKYI